MWEKVKDADYQQFFLLFPKRFQMPSFSLSMRDGIIGNGLSSLTTIVEVFVSCVRGRETVFVTRISCFQGDQAYNTIINILLIWPHFISSF